MEPAIGDSTIEESSSRAKTIGVEGTNPTRRTSKGRVQHGSTVTSDTPPRRGEFSRATASN